MTSVDNFTAASPRFFYATRHPFKQGEAFEVMGARRAAFAILPSLIGAAALLAIVGLVIGAVQ